MKIVPTIAIMVLAMAPMFLFANTVDFNEYRNGALGFAFAGCGYAMKHVSDIWRKRKSLDDVN